MIQRFHFERFEDVSGTSGCGIVAEGCRFSNGHVALTWLSAHPSVNIYESIEDVILIHGHENRTKIVFDDEIKEEVKNKK